MTFQLNYLKLIKPYLKIESVEALHLLEYRLTYLRCHGCIDTESLSKFLLIVYYLLHIVMSTFIISRHFI